MKNSFDKSRRSFLRLSGLGLCTLYVPKVLSYPIEDSRKIDITNFNALKKISKKLKRSIAKDKSLTIEASTLDSPNIKTIIDSYFSTGNLIIQKAEVDYDNKKNVINLSGISSLPFCANSTFSGIIYFKDDTLEFSLSYTPKLSTAKFSDLFPSMELDFTNTLNIENIQITLDSVTSKKNTLPEIFTKLSGLLFDGKNTSATPKDAYQNMTISVTVSKIDQTLSSYPIFPFQDKVTFNGPLAVTKNNEDDTEKYLPQFYLQLDKSNTISVSLGTISTELSLQLTSNFSYDSASKSYIPYSNVWGQGDMAYKKELNMPVFFIITDKDQDEVSVYLDTASSSKLLINDLGSLVGLNDFKEQFPTDIIDQIRVEDVIITIAFDKNITINDITVQISADGPWSFYDQLSLSAIKGTFYYSSSAEYSIDVDCTGIFYNTSYNAYVSYPAMNFALHLADEKKGNLSDVIEDFIPKASKDIDGLTLDSFQVSGNYSAEDSSDMFTITADISTDANWQFTMAEETFQVKNIGFSYSKVTSINYLDSSKNQKPVSINSGTIYGTIDINNDITILLSAMFKGTHWDVTGQIPSDKNNAINISKAIEVLFPKSGIDISKTSLPDVTLDSLFVKFSSNPDDESLILQAVGEVGELSIGSIKTKDVISVFLKYDSANDGTYSGQLSTSLQIPSASTYFLVSVDFSNNDLDILCAWSNEDLSSSFSALDAVKGIANVNASDNVKSFDENFWDLDAVFFSYIEDKNSKSFIFNAISKDLGSAFVYLKNSDNWEYAFGIEVDDEHLSSLPVIGSKLKDFDALTLENCIIYYSSTDDISDLEKVISIDQSIDGQQSAFLSGDSFNALNANYFGVSGDISDSSSAINKKLLQKSKLTFPSSNTSCSLNAKGLYFKAFIDFASPPNGDNTSVLNNFISSTSIESIYLDAEITDDDLEFEVLLNTNQSIFLGKNTTIKLMDFGIGFSTSPFSLSIFGDIASQINGLQLIFNTTMIFTTSSLEGTMNLKTEDGTDPSAILTTFGLSGISLDERGGVIGYLYEEDTFLFGIQAEFQIKGQEINSNGFAAVFSLLVEGEIAIPNLNYFSVYIEELDVKTLSLAFTGKEIDDFPSIAEDVKAQDLIVYFGDNMGTDIYLPDGTEVQNGLGFSATVTIYDYTFLGHITINEQNGINGYLYLDKIDTKHFELKGDNDKDFTQTQVKIDGTWQPQQPINYFNSVTPNSDNSSYETKSETLIEAGGPKITFDTNADNMFSATIGVKLFDISDSKIDLTVDKDEFIFSLKQDFFDHDIVVELGIIMDNDWKKLTVIGECKADFEGYKDKYHLEIDLDFDDDSFSASIWKDKDDKHDIKEDDFSGFSDLKNIIENLF